MRIVTFGVFFIGGVLLASGLGILLSDIDPSALCFKRCDIRRLIGAVFGENVSRVVTGLMFAAIGAAFLTMGVRSIGKSRP